MGTKKFRNPFKTRRQMIDPGAAKILLESSAALQEYNARVHTRREMAQNEEIQRTIDLTDANREIWMWGLFAVTLHRRYRFTAPKIAEILSDVQNLHNELYDRSMDEDDLRRLIYETVRDEVGLEIYDTNVDRGSA